MQILFIHKIDDDQSSQSACQSISVLDAGYEEIKDASAMTLVPVDVTSETNTNSYYYYSNPTTTVTSMTPAVSKPTIGKLKLDEAKVALVYSKQGNNK